MEKINGNYGEKNFYQMYPKGNLSEAFNKLAEMFDKDLENFSNMKPEVKYLYEFCFLIKRKLLMLNFLRKMFIYF